MSNVEDRDNDGGSGAAERMRDGVATVNPGFALSQPQELRPRDFIEPVANRVVADGGAQRDRLQLETDQTQAGETTTEGTVGDNVSIAAAPGVADGGTPVPGSALSAEQIDQMTADIVAALKTVYDPEIPSDIYELGLIYRVDISDTRDVEIDMTLTAPGCPVAGEMPQWVENAVRSVAGVGDVKVNLVFDPPWETSRMSDEARLALNMF